MDTLELVLDDLAATKLASVKKLAKTPTSEALQRALADLRKRGLHREAERLIVVFSEGHPATTVEAALAGERTATATKLASAQADLGVSPCDWSDGARFHVRSKKGAPLYQKLPPKLLARTTSLWLDRGLGRPVVEKLVRAVAKASVSDLNVRQNSVGSSGAKCIAELGGLTRLRMRPNSIGEDVAALAALEELEWLELAEAVKSVAFLEKLSRLRHLGMSHPRLGVGVAKTIAGLPLTSLWMPMTGVGAKGAELVAAMSKLQVLNLGGTALGAPGAKALSRCTALQELSAYATKLGPDGAKLLTKLGKLETLNLSNNPLGDKGAGALASLGALSSLRVDGCKVSKAGFGALARLPKLVSLHASSDCVDDACAKALVGGPAPLRHLSLQYGKLRAAGAQALSEKKELVELDLPGHRIGSEGARALGKLKKLRHLTVSTNGIEAEGAEALAGARGLTALDIGGNPIGDRGVAALAKLTSLRELYINSVGCTKEAAAALAGLTSLRRLSVRDNRMGPAALKTLNAALPDCWIEA